MALTILVLQFEGVHPESGGGTFSSHSSSTLNDVLYSFMVDPQFSSRALVGSNPAVRLHNFAACLRVFGVGPHDQASSLEMLCDSPAMEALTLCDRSDALTTLIRFHHGLWALRS